VAITFAAIFLQTITVDLPAPYSDSHFLNGGSRFPFTLLAAFLAAELSWKLVEQPALKIRRRIERARSSRAESNLDRLAVLPADSSEIAS
jgi:peptidoglycan/LPS O-acetylase OafA/YrhL